MVRPLILLLFLLIAVPRCYAADLQDEPEASFDVSWGSPVSALGSVEYLGSGLGLSVYARVNGPDTFDGLKAKRVEYAYFSGVLMAITVYTDSPPKAVLSVAETAYGASYSDSGTGVYDERWETGDTAIMCGTGLSRIAIASVSISREYEASRQSPTALPVA